MASGLKKASAGEYLLVVLDVMLPGINGFEVLRSVCATSRLPVLLLLTARGEDVDRIVGLEIGADDYLPKPFNPRELVARIRAVLRRTRGEAGSPAARCRKRGRRGTGSGNPHRPRLEGKPVELTSVEFHLLEVLCAKRVSVVPRERLVNAVLSRKFSPFDRSIDMHVSKVRKKLGDTEMTTHQDSAWCRLYFCPATREIPDFLITNFSITDEKPFRSNLSVVLGGAGITFRARHLGDALPSARAVPLGEALRTTVLNEAVTAYEEGNEQQLRQYLRQSGSHAACAGVPVRRARH